MLKKVKSIIVILIIAAAVFAILLTIEKQEVKKYERITLIVAANDVPAGTKLTKENVRDYFQTRKCDVSLNSQYAVKDYEELDGMYVKDKIYANTIAYAYQFSGIDFTNENITDRVKVSFTASLADALIGTLRMGDVVKLYVVNAQSTQAEINELLSYPVIIEEAFDSSGVLIKPGDETTLATNYTITIDKSDEAAFYEKLSTGNVKIVKKVEDDA